jgi:cytochrome c-type biogenesis protein CcmE
MKPKNQRLVLVSAALVAVLAAVLLAMWGLKDRASYFFTPTDIAAGKAVNGQTIRLGGMVQRGSVKHRADGLTIRFTITDGKASLPVEYRGIVPDLFREGSGVVAEGRLTHFGISYPPEKNAIGNMFFADTILAKHDERYMPPELGNLAAERKAGTTLEK